MEDENRSFSWAGLFIKIILVVIFIIFTVWLLSLSTKDMSNSLDVLTDNIFSENLEKMKKVGKEYFTKDRLPEKLGDVERLTLEEMYEQNLILEVKDKNGNACSKENSYISVEKFETEYEMKVYLECSEEKGHVIVTINCSEFGTCTETEVEKEDVKKTEYEYVKHSNGTWGNWGNWSDWSKVEISKLDNRDVETKVEKEEYKYTENITKIDYKDFSKTCRSGYKLTEDGTQCYKIVKDTKNPECADTTNFVSRDGFDCKHMEYLGTTKVCPEGYEAIGNNCKKTVSSLEKETTNPTCPQLEGYLTAKRDGFTCTYTKHIKGERVDTRTGETIPANDANYIYEEVGNPVYKMDLNDYTFKWIHTYAVFKAEVETTSGTAKCPEKYKQVGNTCERSWLTTNTLEAELYCPAKEGYTLKTNFNTCSYEKEIIKTAVCPEGYTKNGTVCTKETKEYESYNKVCTDGYSFTSDGNKCSKEIESTIEKTGVKEITYYRYRLREYLDGTTTYKWSSSKSDKNLLNAGYKLTGRTR